MVSLFFGAHNVHIWCNAMGCGTSWLSSNLLCFRCARRMKYSTPGGQYVLSRLMLCIKWNYVHLGKSHHIWHWFFNQLVTPKSRRFYSACNPLVFVSVCQLKQCCPLYCTSACHARLAFWNHPSRLLNGAYHSNSSQHFTVMSLCTSALSESPRSGRVIWALVSLWFLGCMS